MGSSSCPTHFHYSYLEGTKTHFSSPSFPFLHFFSSCQFVIALYTNNKYQLYTWIIHSFHAFYSSFLSCPLNHDLRWIHLLILNRQVQSFNDLKVTCLAQRLLSVLFRFRLVSDSLHQLTCFERSSDCTSVLEDATTRHFRFFKSLVTSQLIRIILKISFAHLPFLFVPLGAFSTHFDPFLHLTGVHSSSRSLLPFSIISSSPSLFQLNFSLLVASEKGSVHSSDRSSSSIPIFSWLSYHLSRNELRMKIIVCAHSKPGCWSYFQVKGRKQEHIWQNDQGNRRKLYLPLCIYKKNGGQN